MGHVWECQDKEDPPSLPTKTSKSCVRNRINENIGDKPSLNIEISIKCYGTLRRSRQSEQRVDGAG